VLKFIEYINSRQNISIGRNSRDFFGCAIIFAKSSAEILNMSTTLIKTIEINPISQYKFGHIIKQEPPIVYASL